MIFKSATGRNIFAIVGLGLVATMTAAGALLAVSYQNTKSAGLDAMKSAASQTGSAIEAGLRSDYQLVVDMETTMRSLRLSGVGTRAVVLDYMEATLQGAPHLVGVSTGWDADAFDGKDAEYAGTPVHDATGRFLPYVFREGGQIKRDVLVDYDVPGSGDYYILPHDTGKPVLLDPYVYTVGTTDVLMTTISVPTSVDGKTVGYVGADIDLGQAADALARSRPLGDGFVAMLSAQGVIVSHPEKSFMGQPLAESGLDAAAWQSVVGNAGQPVQLKGTDGTPLLAVAVPVRPFEDAVWYAIAAVPESTVFAKLNEMLWTSALIMIAAAVVLGLAGWFIARRFIARVSAVVEQTTSIAAGRLDVTLTERDRSDELGDLSRSLGVLLDNSRKKVELEAGAEKSRQSQEAERIERARLASAQEEETRFVVTELANGLSRLSNGDMTVRLDTPFTATFDAIRADFNMSVEKLQAAMVSFAENAATIETGTREISAAADDLARRTEQQAASVEETAAALEEITTSVKDSTRRAEDAGKLVHRTKEGAERSGDVVRRAVSAMSAIEESSRSISNIIGVIDEIAFQTNLLALNAGVEAARAGEAGKGFAVVAQEVRELAQRSANAAKEIKALITASGEQVTHGVALVGETGQALEAIVSEVQEINTNVQAIVQAAREQSTGLNEINTAVNVMDQGTQRNAAMVEETNAASMTLVQEVATLSARLGQFNLGQQVQRRGPASAAPTKAAPAPLPRPAAAPARGVAPAPALAGRASKPAASPARALGSKLATAFAAPADSAPARSDWEEF